MAVTNGKHPPFTPEETHKYGKMGGIASGKVRNRKKTIAQKLAWTLEQRVTDKKQLDMIERAGIPISGKPTYKDFLIASTLMKSIKNGRVDDMMKVAQFIGEDYGSTVPGEEIRDDELSASLRELAEDLQSDDQ